MRTYMHIFINSFSLILISSNIYNPPGGLCADASYQNCYISPNVMVYCGCYLQFVLWLRWVYWQYACFFTCLSETRSCLIPMSNSGQNHLSWYEHQHGEMLNINAQWQHLSSPCHVPFVGWLEVIPLSEWHVSILPMSRSLSSYIALYILYISVCIYEYIYVWIIS